ncbi:Sulfotransferase, partial [Trichostrongylus colubriformis]
FDHRRLCATATLRFHKAESSSRCINKKRFQVVVEKTPGYFTSPVAPKRVREMDPTMKIILIVRDPTQRTISDFTQVYYNKLEQNKTLPIFEKEVFLPNSELINPEYKPVRNSLYDVHMANWLRYFSMEQILLVNGDVFRGNPINEVRIYS